MPLPSDFPSRKCIRDGFVIALISICLFIPAAELTLRALCTYCTWAEENQGHYVSPYAMNNSSWYHLRPPNAVDSYQQPEFDHEIRTNSLGFRDIEHPVTKPPGELRIVAIGDSFTEGQGASFEKTWLNQLGRMLSGEHTGKDFRMICGGVAGSDPFFGYRSLVDKLLVYEPDFVLLVVNHGDILDVMVRGGMERFLANGTVEGVDPPDTAWLYESSHLARFILFEMFDYTHYLITRSESEKRTEQALKKIMHLIGEYNTLLGSMDIGFSLVILPFRGELKRNQYQKLNLLRDFALRHGISAIDTKPYLYEKLLEHGNRLEDLYWPGDNHFTELGYRYFAEAVEAGLGPKIGDVEADASPSID